MSQPAGTLTFDEFLKVKLRVAKVLEAEEHPNADKLLVLKVDLGDEQRQIVAGLKKHYAPADLVGRNIVVVANLAPRKMRGFESQGMLLAACTENESQVVVISPADDVPPGTTVT
jgi:methionine--tRNA ligase beta chain